MAEKCEFHRACDNQTNNSSPSENPSVRIIEEADCSEIKIFYQPERFRMDERKMNTILNGLTFFGNVCSGYDLDRMSRGDIRIYFNPICHTADDRHRVIEKVTEEITKNLFSPPEEIED